MTVTKPRKNLHSSPFPVHHRTDFLDLPLLPLSIPVQSTFVIFRSRAPTIVDESISVPRAFLSRKLLAHSSSAHIYVPIRLGAVGIPADWPDRPPPPVAILCRGWTLKLEQLRGICRAGPVMSNFIFTISPSFIPASLPCQWSYQHGLPLLLSHRRARHGQRVPETLRWTTRQTIHLNDAKPRIASIFQRLFRYLPSSSRLSLSWLAIFLASTTQTRVFPCRWHLVQLESSSKTTGQWARVPPVFPVCPSRSSYQTKKTQKRKRDKASRKPTRKASRKEQRESQTLLYLAYTSTAVVHRRTLLQINDTRLAKFSLVGALVADPSGNEFGSLRRVVLRVPGT
jgi:hypothetical protein